MNLITIKRYLGTKTETLGKMTIGDFSCYTLEDTNRSKKQFGVTCIPGGDYETKMTFSPKFNKKLPIIYNKPDLTVRNLAGDQWQGIRIHGGVTAKHSHGCILVGAKAVCGNKLSGLQDENGNLLQNYILDSASILPRILELFGDKTFKLHITYENELKDGEVVYPVPTSYSRPVAVAQMKLCDLGYDIIVDGLFGNATLTAIRQAVGVSTITYLDRGILQVLIDMK